MSEEMTQEQIQESYKLLDTALKNSEGKGFWSSVAFAMERSGAIWEMAIFRRQIQDMNRYILEHCPFCGSYNVAVMTDVTHHKKTFWVSCRYCDTTGPGKSTEELSVKAWNSRVI